MATQWKVKGLPDDEVIKVLIYLNVHRKIKGLTTDEVGIIPYVHSNFNILLESSNFLSTLNT